MSNKVTPKFANEFLAYISEAAGDEQLRLLKEYGGKPPLNYLLSLNFNKTVSLQLPEGTPPHKRNEADHPDLFSPLSAHIGRLKNCMSKVTNVPKLKKERIFIEMMEIINPAEGDILVACKDRALNELYPKITADLVKSVFPHYVA